MDNIIFLIILSFMSPLMCKEKKGKRRGPGRTKLLEISLSEMSHGESVLVDKANIRPGSCLLTVCGQKTEKTSPAVKSLQSVNTACLLSLS